MTASRVRPTMQDRHRRVPPSASSGTGPAPSPGPAPAPSPGPAPAPRPTSADGLLWVGLFVLLSFVQITLVLASWEGRFLEKVWVLGAMLSVLVIDEWRRVGHPLTPAGIIGTGSLLVFVLRPLTIASRGATTAGASLDARGFSGQTAAAAVLAANQVALFFVVFGIVYSVFVHRPMAAASSPVPRQSVSPWQVQRARRLLLAVTLLTGAVSVYLLQSLGGVGAFVSGLSVRSSFLSGKFYLTLGYLPLAASLVVYLLMRESHVPGKAWDRTARVSLVVLVLSASTGGGRGPLLLGVLLPLLIVRQFSRPIRTPVLLGTGLAVLVGAMLMSVFLRENVYTEGAALAQLRESPVNALLDRLTSGAETRPFDSLIVLNSADISGELPVLYGSTYASVPTWFVPGSIAGDKGGANTWFTQTYLPRFYYPDHIETSISAPGEAFANFRWAGIVGIGAGLAVLAAAFSRRRRRTVLAMALTALLAPLFFSLTRGDSYQNIPVALLLTLSVVLAHRVAVGRRPVLRVARVEPRVTQRRRGEHPAP
ncbi:MAG: O-antigen polysaccharide polymerase Wzy [Humibacillus sp.]|nr:O-antigen polysaccharide polymerase Wzy [Humibacillus sp.]